MSAFWSWFVVAIVASNVFGCLWLLLYTSRKRPGDKASTETTGHRWDGDLTELNNPMPRWWLYLFVGTCAFALVYLALYPGAGSFAGTLGWTQVGQYDAEVAARRERETVLFAAFAGQEVSALATDPAAVATGGRLYANNCSTCHGADGRGAPGFPDLTDGDWLYGGDDATIVASITHGRGGLMPPFASVLGEQGVAEVAAYAYGLGGRPLDPAMGSLAARGEARFVQACAACHGADGKGNPALGAPNLADDVWLYGGSFDAIKQTVVHGRNGRMPAHGTLLGEQRVLLVAAYVRSLGAR
jgi:cytochrome c oxidase cbb3-type subunit 3